MAYQYLPGLTPQGFGRHTPKEIEQRIHAGKLRLLQAWDLGAFVAAHIMNSMAKYPAGPMTGTRLLGREPIPIDARAVPTPEPAVVDTRSLVLGDPTMPDATQQALMAKAGIGTGYLTPEEVELAYAQLDPHWQDRA